MTSRDIARLAFRVLAVWAVIDAVKPLQSATTSLMWLSRTLRLGGGDWLLFAAQAITVLFPLLQLCLAWWLWRNASVVASWSLGHALHDERDEPAQSPHRANLQEVESIVVAALGLWLLISSVPQIVSQTLGFLVAYVTSNRPALDAGAMVVDENIWIWAIQFVIGLWLIFGASGITRMLRRARGAPVNEREPSQP